MFVAAGVLWLAQMLVSGYSDSTVQANKAARFWSGVRVLLVICMILFFLAGIVRFVRWVWNA